MEQLDDLPSEMECVVCHGPHDYRHGDRPVPRCRPRRSAAEGAQRRPVRQRRGLLEGRIRLLARRRHAGIRAAAGGAGSRIRGHRGGPRRWRRLQVRPGARRHRHQRADHSVLGLSLLQAGPVLDVPARRDLRVSPALSWGDGHLHGVPLQLDQPQGARRGADRPRRVHRALGMRHPRRGPGGHHSRRHGGGGRLRADRAGDDRGGPASPARPAGGVGLPRRAPIAGLGERRRSCARSGRRRRDRRGAGPHRGLRLRRVSRGVRASVGRQPGPAHDPQAGHVRGVRRVQGAGHHRVVDHRRPQGTRRSRGAPGTLLLPPGRWTCWRRARCRWTGSSPTGWPSARSTRRWRWWPEAPTRSR